MAQLLIPSGGGCYLPPTSAASQTLISFLICDFLIGIRYWFLPGGNVCALFPDPAPLRRSYCYEENL